MACVHRTFGFEQKERKERDLIGFQAVYLDTSFPVYECEIDAFVID